MNYSILRDEGHLEEFIAGVVPELEIEESFLLILAARKKYLLPGESDTVSLPGTEIFRREFVSDPKHLVQRVKEMCVSHDLYCDRDGTPIPEHAMVLYMTINPRSHRKAALATIKALSDRLFDGQPIRLVTLAKTQLHQAVSRKVFLDFDIDPEGEDELELILDRVYAVMGDTPLETIRTRSGAHVLVRAKAVDPRVKKSFHHEVEKISREMTGIIEFRADTMIPLPGTCQGGSIPRWSGTERGKR